MAYWTIKQRAREQARLRPEPEYAPIEMPRNSPTGFVCAFFATLMGFALIWHIWWLVGLGGVGAFATFVVALAFGVLIVVLIIGGSIWIMESMNYNMMPMGPAVLQP